MNMIRVICDMEPILDASKRLKSKTQPPYVYVSPRVAWANRVNKDKGGTTYRCTKCSCIVHLKAAVN